MFAINLSLLSLVIISLFLFGPNHFRLNSVLVNSWTSPPGDVHLPINFKCSSTNRFNSDKLPFHRYSLSATNKIVVTIEDVRHLLPGRGKLTAELCRDEELEISCLDAMGERHISSPSTRFRSIVSKS